ncbi:MAG: L-2-amino-thiazoline-4-carboxylic acid hydrolase [Clostridia bacterium]|nr:L-2-amino-thiazoline-4-carboxylic acid hydrolase [Clostridia bacterium]
MNPLNRQWFYRGFRKRLAALLGRDAAGRLWENAGKEYSRILASQPELKRHKGAMTLPAVALYRALTAGGIDAEGLLNSYGEDMGKRFARIIHVLTSLPGADRLVWRHVSGVMEKASSEKLGYKRELVSEPPDMYGVDILSCPYHELAKQLGDEKAVLCICHMDKEYSRGFRHIRYDRYSAVSEGAQACEYRLRFDPEKE